MQIQLACERWSLTLSYSKTHVLLIMERAGLPQRRKNHPRMDLSSKGFSSSALMTFGAGNSLWWRLTCASRTFSSITAFSLYPIPVAPPPPLNPKRLQILKISGRGWGGGDRCPNCPELRTTGPAANFTHC